MTEHGKSLPPEIQNKKPVLLVENDVEDIIIARRAYSQVDISNPLIVHRDVGETVDFLDDTRGSPVNSPPLRPALILMDLNLPGTDGFSLLNHLKGSHDSCYIPVVVMTTSNSQTDINTCYQLGANSYVIKPIKYGEFVDIMVTVMKYWFNTAQRPTQPERGAHGQQ